MASGASRTLVRNALRTSIRTSSPAVPRHALRQASWKRFYSSEAPPNAKGPNPSSSSSSSSSWIWLTGAAVAGAGGSVWYLNHRDEAGPKAAAKPFVPTFDDYQKVYNEIAERLEEKDDYDDGSYGPVLLRLAWHCSGTYDVATGTGGSNGATMRFSPESDHGANAGLKAARDFLEPVKGKRSRSSLDMIPYPNVVPSPQGLRISG